jgi:hypothetical protein
MSEGSICFKWSAPCAFKNKRQAVGARAGRGGLDRFPQSEPPALRSGDRVLDAKRLGVDVRPERENGFGCWLSDVPPLAWAVRRR